MLKKNSEKEKQTKKGCYSQLLREQKTTTRHKRLECWCDVRCLCHPPGGTAEHRTPAPCPDSTGIALNPNIRFSDTSKSA